MDYNLSTIPTKDRRELYMRAVYLNAEYSKDLMTRIGAVLVKNDTIISCGFNSFPRKVKDIVARYEDREMKHLFVVHGEANCLLNAARHGINTSGSTLYTCGYPCNECSKQIIQCNVSKVVLHKQWPNLNHSDKWIKATKISKIMLEEAGVKIEWFDKELGMIGWLDGKIVQV